MEYTNNNFYSDHINSPLSQTKYKPASYRTAKLFGKHPNISYNKSLADLKQGFNFTLKTTKYQFPKLQKPKKPIEYDSEYLKNDLMSYRSNIQQKKK